MIYKFLDDDIRDVLALSHAKVALIQIGYGAAFNQPSFYKKHGVTNLNPILDQVDGTVSMYGTMQKAIDVYTCVLLQKAKDKRSGFSGFFNRYFWKTNGIKDIQRQLASIRYFKGRHVKYDISLVE